MTLDDPPQPPDDPEQEGIPDYAADTSTAYDEDERPRFDDSPPALPADRPQAVDEPAVAEPPARGGEPLADRLDREEPEVSAEAPASAPEPDLSGEVVTESTEAQASRDAEVLGAGRGPATDRVSAGEVAPEYDAPASGERVGRLADPDEGARGDTEKDLIASDRGEAGGGLAAEEAAMHEVEEDEVPYEP